MLRRSFGVNAAAPAPTRMAFYGIALSPRHQPTKHGLVSSKWPSRGGRAAGSSWSRQGRSGETLLTLDAVDHPSSLPVRTVDVCRWAITEPSGQHLLMQLTLGGSVLFLMWPVTVVSVTQTGLDPGWSGLGSAALIICSSLWSVQLEDGEWISPPAESI